MTLLHNSAYYAGSAKSVHLIGNKVNSDQNILIYVKITLTPTSPPQPSVLANPVWSYWPSPAASVCGPWVLPLDTALCLQRTRLKHWQPGRVTSATGMTIPSSHVTNTSQSCSTHTHIHVFNGPLSRTMIPKLWPAASYKMARQDLWLRIFYLHHISV